MFVKSVIKTVDEFYGKDPQKSKDFSRIINEYHVLRLASILEKTPKNDIVLGGTVDLKDHYVSPTIIVNVTGDSEVMQSEVRFLSTSNLLNRSLDQFFPFLHLIT
jgi:aldehyde dehydrogenase (NAD+)